ncbi:MAG TPA: diacylglycerol kinase family protein [Chthoniobacterales bacterium]|jgi:diacylglycerol kinase (ATP)|nr:diacylglycerol kinase family protein [Chthoniobacterales bacterium]
MKPCIIVNPIAGSIKDLEVLLKKLRRLRPGELHLTHKSGDAETFARKAIRAGCDYVIAAGGDGTLNEVVNGIASPRRAREICVGVVPLGTGNDFARSLGLPATLEENIDILRSRQTAPVDLVRVRSDRTRYFVNVSTGGFSGLVNEKLTPKIKRAWGPLAYVRSAAAALPDLHAYRTTIVLDGMERLSIDLYNVIIANGRFVAAGLPIAPNADPSDGLLDLVLIPKLPKPEMALLATEMVLGKHLSSNALIFRRAKKISVRSRPGMWFNVDGEAVGNEPAVFQVVRRALNFVVSKR